MDKSLGYLQEALSNYIEKYPTCQGVFNKLEQKKYSTEVEFVEDLAEEEIKVLELILKHEMNHARNEDDQVRTHELNEVYELLF
ncbi:sporulation protein [Alkalihalophilus pseudofirmus]|uniref:sporulation protein n=1 Tax=Alkalihalobacterium alkalinitrilicum TaxID=427920 RepID=UPI00094DE3AC|nr:sporulation protein [Alkalihalobacterium alkalinitrilicum]OLO42722.1 sporulation protein [Alkalihalophilus pseudofirmus]